MITIGGNNVSSIYIGDTTVKNVYLGNVEVWGSGPTPDYRAIKFRASTSDGAYVSLQNNGGNTPTLEYSYDGINWTAWDYSNLSVPYSPYFDNNVGLYIRGINTSGFSSSSSVYSQFVTNVVSGYIFVSGNIMHLIDWQELTPLDEVNDYEFYKLFMNCTNTRFYRGGVSFDDDEYLSLPATTLGKYCYNQMFRGCTSFGERTPELPATVMKENCYEGMFYGCTNLQKAGADISPVPYLPATTLAKSCYNNMFRNCANLCVNIVLPAVTLSEACYQNMFAGCSRMNYIKCYAVNNISGNTNNWLFGVAATGTFYKDAAAVFTLNSPNGIPSGWKVDMDNAIKFTSVEESLIGMTNIGGNTPNLEYSKDGNTWTTWDYSQIYLLLGESVWMRGINTTGFSSSTSKYSTFTISEKTLCDGNIMSLLNYQNIDSAVLHDYEFYKLFYECGNLRRNYYNEIQLPATTLAPHCYEYMFYRCTGLSSTPTLPAATLSDSCYAKMFRECSNITAVPYLNAEILAENCYDSMFQGCTSLTNARSLPAVNLEYRCYSNMFNGCTALTSAPALAATTLAEYCYSNMFQGCTLLTSAPVLNASALVAGCYNQMFNGCSNLRTLACYAKTGLDEYNATNNWLQNVGSNGMFIRDADTTWTRGASGIPNDWSISPAI